MRKIESNKEIEKKRKRNILIISAFMFLVLVIGTAGYAFLSGSGFTSTNPQNPSNSDVTFTGTNWIVKINNQDYQFSNPPDAVANITVNANVGLANYAGLPLYVVSDNNAVNLEVYSVLGRHAARIQEACYGPCEKDLVEKDCSENLIIWQDSPNNRVFQEQKCIFIEGDLRAVDAFLYKVLGY